MTFEKKINANTNELRDKVLFLLVRDAIYDNSKFSVVDNDILANKFVVGNIIDRFNDIVRIDIVESVWSSLFLELINELEYVIYKNYLIFYVPNIESII